MRYLFALFCLFILTSCVHPEPKFHRNQAVYISKGFYVGCIGKTIDFMWDLNDEMFSYNLRIDVESDNCPKYLVGIREDELEAK